MLSPVIIDVIYSEKDRLSLTAASASTAVIGQDLQLEGAPASQVGDVRMLPEALFALILVVLKSMRLLPFVEETPWLVNSALSALSPVLIDQCSWFIRHKSIVLQITEIWH